MATLTVINENGVQTDVQVRESNTELRIQNTELRPKVVQRLEYERQPDMSGITTVCGEEENRQESEGKPTMVIDGVIVKSQLPDFKQIDRGNDITVLSDIEDGDFIVKRISIEQNSDLVEYKPNGGTAELAFKLQLQLKRP